MIFSLLLSLLELLLGLVIPAYGSFLVLSKGKNGSTEDHKRWGAYWIIMVFLRVIVFQVLDQLPSALSTIVLLIRVLITAYLVLPQTKGSVTLWNKFLADEGFINNLKAKFGKLAGSKAE